MINIDNISNLFSQYSNPFTNKFTTNLFNGFTEQFTTQFTTNLFNKINKHIINSKLADYVINAGFAIAFSLAFAPGFTRNSMKSALKLSLIMAPIMAKINIGLLGIKTISDASNYIIKETLAQLEKLSHVSNDWSTLYNKMRNLFVNTPDAPTIIQEILSKGPFSNIMQEAATDPNISVSYDFSEQLCNNKQPNCLENFSITIQTPTSKQKPYLLFSLNQIRDKLHEVKNDENPILCNIKEEVNKENLLQRLSCDSLEYRAAKKSSFRYA